MDATDQAVVAHKWGLFLELMRWAEGGTCRHDAILRYFGDEAETLDGCGQCDVCQTHAASRRRAPRRRRSSCARRCRAVARIHRQFGLQAAVKLLRGEADPRLERSGLDRTPTFGALRERSEAWLLQLLRRCVTAGWVDFDGGDRPVVLLTEAGRAVMKAERPARLLLPPERRRGRGARRADARGGRAARPAAAAAWRRAAPRRSCSRRCARTGSRSRAAEGVPPYVVASDRTLREIAVLAPRTRADLMQVHGIGPAKADRYGAGLLRVVEQARSPA